ncbi:hypothetical protein L596_008963 [Steinernema carpocapsae]|uniref:Uncharacterized protein n=1 Tax=Steinernema carpocapsae TaxID=34508 RepID=A0A4U5PEB7_STECR|nr:hypothetical protein L596_008963 [Steinernema carpocapsae]
MCVKTKVAGSVSTAWVCSKRSQPVRSESHFGAEGATYSGTQLSNTRGGRLEATSFKSRSGRSRHAGSSKGRFLCFFCFRWDRTQSRETVV